MGECRGLLLVLLFAIVPVAARSQGCDAPPDQASMDRCAGASLRRSDAALNATYRQLSGRLAGDPAKQRLFVAAERAWLRFRDAECAFSASGAEGGSVYPAIVAACREDLTTTRNADLKKLLKCPEGDLTCPIPTP